MFHSLNLGAYFFGSLFLVAEGLCYSTEVSGRESGIGLSAGTGIKTKHFFILAEIGSSSAWRSGLPKTYFSDRPVPMA